MAKKTKGRYRSCRICETKFPVERSQCPSCKAWNLLAGSGTKSINDDGTVLLSEVSSAEESRITTGPWDPCFGGGIVRGSCTLIGGAPGAGKTTVSLQIADCIAGIEKREVIYIASEMQSSAVRSYADRIKLRHPKMIRVFPMGNSADLGDVLTNRKPCAIVLDSLAGSAENIEAEVEMAEALKEYAVMLNAPAILINHVNKQDDFAGLMKLQHAVDTTISFFPIHDQVREMTTVKSRYGETLSIHLLMTEFGLEELEMQDEEDDDE